MTPTRVKNPGPEGNGFATVLSLSRYASSSSLLHLNGVTDDRVEKKRGVNALPRTHAIRHVQCLWSSPSPRAAGVLCAAEMVLGTTSARPPPRTQCLWTSPSPRAALQGVLCRAETILGTTQPGPMPPLLFSALCPDMFTAPTLSPTLGLDRRAYTRAHPKFTASTLSCAAAAPAPREHAGLAAVGGCRAMIVGLRGASSSVPYVSFLARFAPPVDKAHRECIRGHIGALMGCPSKVIWLSCIDSLHFTSLARVALMRVLGRQRQDAGVQL
ncbi:hypothetical protein FB451DRAFT_1409437 [Mycena latifolia]|nr:hypothetical protein FB451DRAFT_1409437 [Mycena latifolia]